MNILVTGGAGFIGCNLVKELLVQGHRVTVIDNLSTGLYQNVEPFLSHPLFSFLEGTVTDKPVMDGLIQNCDQCFHLAAPVGVKYIMDNPVLTILDNIRGIDVILEAANKYNKRVLVASTSEVYGKSLDLLDASGSRKLNEEDYRVEGSSINHRWAYANSKSMDEFLSLAYHKQFGTEVVITRLFNTVGPQQLSVYGMVIPNFVQAALRNEPIPIFGTGLQKRSFMHVNDVIRALLGLMNSKAATGRVFNVGNPFEITILELAEQIIAKTGSNGGIKYIPYEVAYGKGFEDMNRRTADISRLKETLGFEIENDLHDILGDIIQYQREKMAKL